jgi:hypothetical protein
MKVYQRQKKTLLNIEIIIMDKYGNQVKKIEKFRFCYVTNSAYNPAQNPIPM